MRLITKKPIWIGGVVVEVGKEFTTNEQHGRELIRKEYAEKSSDQTEPEGETSVQAQSTALTSDNVNRAGTRGVSPENGDTFEAEPVRQTRAKAKDKPQDEK